jgi:hypothetical protein
VKTLLAVIVLIIGLGFALELVAAQEKPAPPLDDLTQAWVDAVVQANSAENIALDAVKATPEYKRYEQAAQNRQQMQADRTKKIESKFPGFTLDWAKRVLVPKDKDKK